MLGCTGLKITLLKFNQNGNTVVIILFFLNIFQIKVVRLENLWEEISFENAHSRTVSNATNEDFFIARTIKGHNSAKLSAETSTTGTFSKRADIFPRETPKPPGVIGEFSGKTWGEQCSRVEGTKMAVRNHQAKFAWKKLVIS